MSWLLILLLIQPISAQNWQSATDGRFIVETAAVADREQLSAVFAILQEAKDDLSQNWQLDLPETVTVRIHPDLASFQVATKKPWYVAAVANKPTATFHTQRLRVLLERDSLEKTLRHELFHLAQPDDWSRWRAEGTAMRFAGETPSAEPFKQISETELNYLLATASSKQELARAVATAYKWVKRF